MRKTIFHYAKTWKITILYLFSQNEISEEKILAIKKSYEIEGIYWNKVPTTQDECFPSLEKSKIPVKIEFQNWLSTLW